MIIISDGSFPSISFYSNGFVISSSSTSDIKYDIRFGWRWNFSVWENHRSHAIQQSMADEGVIILYYWIAQIPDLNSIEQLRTELKRIIRLINLHKLEVLRELSHRECHLMPTKIVKDLFAPRRTEVIIQVNGSQHGK